MSLRSHPSRRLAALAAGALMAAPLLSSCGFDYATDRVNTISAGVNDREGDIDVLGAVIIAGEPDLGLFVATFVNNSKDAEAALSGIAQGQDDAGVAPIDTAATTVEVPPAGRTSLFDTGGIGVRGTFGAGDFVDVTLNFDNGQVTTLQVPVVTACHQYSLEKLTELELPTAGGQAAPAEETAEGEESHSEDEQHAATTDPYSCDAAEPVEHGAHAEGEE